VGFSNVMRAGSAPGFMRSADRCFPAYSLSLSIISGFPVLPSAPYQRRYLPIKNISVNRFPRRILSESCLAPAQPSSSDSKTLSGTFFLLFYQPLSISENPFDQRHQR
jgi:hypothetical protein